MTLEIKTNCSKCVKDFHDECQNENCLCRHNNHGKKKETLQIQLRSL